MKTIQLLVYCDFIVQWKLGYPVAVNYYPMCLSILYLEIVSNDRSKIILKKIQSISQEVTLLKSRCPQIKKFNWFLSFYFLAPLHFTPQYILVPSHIL